MPFSQDWQEPEMYHISFWKLRRKRWLRHPHWQSGANRGCHTLWVVDTSTLVLRSFGGACVCPLPHSDSLCLQGSKTELTVLVCLSIYRAQERVQSTIQGAALNLGPTSALPPGFPEWWLNTSFNQIRISGCVCVLNTPQKGHVFKQCWGLLAWT